MEKYIFELTVNLYVDNVLDRGAIGERLVFCEGIVVSTVTPVRTTAEIIELFGEPFARAFATFVLELAKSGLIDLPSSNGAASRPGTAGADPPVVEAIEKEDFTHVAGHSVVEGIAVRLRRIIKSRGLTQKQLAEKLGVSSARISSVLKNPDRSKVDTLRKITDALDIELREML